MTASVGCDATVASGLDEEEANRVIVALDREGIPAGKEPAGAGAEGWAVSVPSDDVGRALGVLGAAELPRRPSPGLAEVFGEGGLVPTATEERAKLAAALGGELSRSIETIDGVLDARVHVALPDRSGLSLEEQAPRPRASVLIKQATGSEPVDPERIRALVTGAVHDLASEEVSVVVMTSAPPPTSESALVKLGPFSVARGSAGTLKLVLGTSLLLHVVLAALLVFVTLRRRREAEPTPDTAPETR